MRSECRAMSDAEIVGAVIRVLRLRPTNAWLTNCAN
jgi:hypothetical protein